MGWGEDAWNTVTGGGSSSTGMGTGFIGDPRTLWNDLSGQGAKDAAKAGYQGAYGSGQAAYDAMMKQNASMDKNDQSYTSGVRDAYNRAIGGLDAPFAQYDQDLTKMIQQAQGQANDGRKVYNGSIEPMMRSNMEVAARNAASSMSLADAMDPNNPLAQQIRGEYDRQAQGEMRQAGASSNVLTALGGLQLGMQQQGGPMTGAQQQAAYADATAPAGDRMAQGVQRAGDLRNAGDQAALDQTAGMYQAGLNARSGAAGAAADYLGSGRAFREGQAGSREQLRNIYGERSNAKTAKNQTIADMFTQMNQADLEAAKRKAERDAAAVNAKYGTQIAAKGAEVNQRSTNASNQGNTILNIGGKFLGAMA